MRKEYDVVALGELLIDFTENGISQQGNPMLEANPGGAPCNVLAMLQNFGKKTAFIGKVGNDHLGHMLKDTLVNIGIDVSNLQMDDQVPTTLAFVHTKDDGDRSFSFYRNPGADVMLQASEINEELFQSAKLFHFGTLSLTHENARKATEKAVSLATQNEMLISFDPNLRPPLWAKLSDAKSAMEYGMRHCDILKISDDEIEFFTGCKDIKKGIEAIYNEFQIPIICATMGKSGSFVLYKDMLLECPPFLNENTIETTGAGDTFMACLIKHVLDVGLDSFTEGSLMAMLTEANAAASLITTKRGALRVMPKEDEIEEYRKAANR